ncbi:AMP-binding protein [Rhodococcus sp. OK302]|uniref:AMP-binding protein n=1 Tax=Rhodococcus sp. OK302 TaxID=1882769 RepID=UPI000B9F2903|nr:AMP-binding protein [Rhodococcus sp. OK302]OYD66515.1 acyl-CoA synthetase (AMP-forming)/AMP-acid ligase II [Rhodococcus sp. OK302]
MPINVNDFVNRRADNRWDRTAVGDLLERMTWSKPDKTAIVGWDGAYASEKFERLTYAQANALANQFANGLIDRGLQRGDVVMLYCDNSVEAWLAKFGIAKAGLVCAPANTLMAPDVVDGLIELTDPKFLVVDADLWDRVATSFEGRGVRAGVSIPFGDVSVAGSETFEDFCAAQPTTEPDVVIHGDDIWEILFTSGTTAAPKGVMLSHNACYFAAYSFALSLTRGLRFESDLVQCSFLPLIYHIGDNLFSMSTILSGGTLVMGRKPDPAQICRAIDREKVTSLFTGSPAMTAAVDKTLTENREFDASSLTNITYGWAALPPTVLASLKRHCGNDLNVFAIFGQTEAIACHRFWPDEWSDLYARTAPNENYVGVPSPILASKVVDPAGGDIVDPADGPGEAVYRSPVVCSGYYRDEQATREAFADGWFHSGDSCAIGESGHRIMVDRYKDIVKTGGENVATIRVEAVLAQHPAVTRATVVGLPHERWGEAVTALVITEDGSQVSSGELLAYCRANLAGFESPKGLVFVESFPETVGGKVLKYKLRQEYADFYSS